MLRIGLLVLGFAVAAPAAHADYTADYKTSSPARGGAGNMTGKIYFKNKRVRMDMSPGGQRMSVISGGDSKDAKIINHGNKTVMTVNPEEAGQNLPKCDPSSFMSCMKSMGYKEVGSDTIDGRPTKILEKTERPKAGNPVVFRMWHPTDMKDVGFLRMEGKDASSGEVQYRMDISNIKHGPLSNDVFAVPSGYKAQAMPSMPPGMPSAAEMEGKSKEEIMQMMRERMGKKRGH